MSNTEDLTQQSRLQPWIDNPFRLLSWLDMNEFSARAYVDLNGRLQLLQRHDWNPKADSAEAANAIEWLRDIAGKCRDIELKYCALQAERFIEGLENKWLTEEVAKDRAGELSRLIRETMDDHLFFWVPPDRAKFYSQKCRDILGVDCLLRFTKSDIANEAEQAAKCFAFGQYTACAFHMMRVSEAGVSALGAAIGCRVQGNANWGRVFGEFDKQSAVPRDKRTGRWATDGDFLDDIGANLRAVKNAWRNAAMHLDKTYSEDQAKFILAVVPTFMRQLAEKIDEDGNWI